MGWKQDGWRRCSSSLPPFRNSSERMGHPRSRLRRKSFTTLRLRSGQAPTRSARSFSFFIAVSYPVGARGEVEKRVEFQHTLMAWREELPAVLATPNMIGWMEAAGFHALLPFCEGDEVSVGTAINIVHRAPTGVGATVKSEAVLESFDGRFYTFRA